VFLSQYRPKVPQVKIKSIVLECMYMGIARGREQDRFIIQKCEDTYQGGGMAMTKDAAVCPVIKGGPTEPMGRCGEGWNGAGGDRAGIWVSVNRWGHRRGDSDSPGLSKAFWMISIIYTPPKDKKREGAAML
jgi:hypothetical protein